MALTRPDKGNLQGVAEELEKALDALRDATLIEDRMAHSFGSDDDFDEASEEVRLATQYIRDLFAPKVSQMKRAMLVYQNGLANVFAVECFSLVNCSRDARRLIQADFRTCEAFAHGLGVAGVTVRTAVCNQSDDIIDAHWTTDLETQPLANGFRPIYMHQGVHV